ncbi:hypothetical protein TUM4438_10190 [Shewanella sairae]|uniref:Uncharacterized protein n=1 Tax=Shewanella sairae TaxID=190310 RepID=A0ABQ4P5P9_9GAMM|nr:hypothetical protein [Shewanella sairae]MCL1130453.1 hypothetical protein [Shewanella sairae]GIU42797.1 hypothetical protein TUM4438_10190 [Shewanella sairae]
MKNISISMVYRCGANWKTNSEVIIKGRSGFNEIQSLIELQGLDDWAIPELLGLPSCYSFDPLTGDSFDAEFDHPYVSIEVELTNKRETSALTPQAFIERCKAHNHDAYLLPFQR